MLIFIIQRSNKTAYLKAALLPPISLQTFKNVNKFLFF